MASNINQIKNDDFNRLESANNNIVLALRADEEDGDMYRRLVSIASAVSNTGTTTDTVSKASSTTSSGPVLPLLHGYFPAAGGTTITGTTFNEYQRQQQHSTPSSNISYTHSIPIPPFLTKEMSGKAHVSSLMGLLPEANLAWITVDCTCYLWSYNNSYTDFCKFTVPSQQCITCVGISKPKVGIFKSQVSWILIITTPEEVLLSALLLSTSSTDNLRLIPTTFSLPTDGCSIYNIKSTKDGRIFLGTSDGNLLEFCYQVDCTTATTTFTEDDFDVDYDDDDDEHDTASTTWTSTILSGSKRLLRDFLFSSSKGEPQRKKQCRKVNHTQPSFFATLFPSFLHSLVLLSSLTNTDGSPIVDVVIDDEEQNNKSLIHALNANGILYTYEMKKELHLLSQINIQKTAILYLESLTRYTTTIPTNNIDYSFAGGKSCALLGLGGTIDSVKHILKVTSSSDQQQQKQKGIFHPLRMFVIPSHVSSHLCLVLVSEGGFRFYLSSSDKTTTTSTTKIKLCHVRAPPSINTTDSSAGISVAVSPGILVTTNKHKQQQTTAIASSYYDACNQTLILGLDGYDVGSEDDYIGDLIVACIPDVACRTSDSNIRTTSSVTTVNNNGWNEVFSSPTCINGGRIWQITGTSTSTDGTLSQLIHTSTTPSPSVLLAESKQPPLPACPAIVMLKQNNKKKYKLFLAKSSMENKGVIKTNNTTIINYNNKQITSLPLLAQQLYEYLFNSHHSDILILNSGGIHVYKVSSILELFSQMLVSSEQQHDAMPKRFIASYGQVEVCSMCLAIAISSNTTTTNNLHAKRMALAHGGRPSMTVDDTTGTSMEQQQQSFLFRPSSLHQGLVILLGRLLRPAWFKPFVVVTAPILLKVKKNKRQRFRPHHAEVVFDPNLLLSELKALQKLMKDIFTRAIDNVPASTAATVVGRRRKDNGMDVDELLLISPASTRQIGGYVTAAALMHHSSTQQQPQADIQAMARLYEETSIHNIYRLLSRTTQALTLLSILLRRYHDDQQQIEWGFLHNLTLYQIVCVPEAADRVTALLQSVLLSSSSSSDYYNDINNNSNNINQMVAQELSSQCYLYFSKSDYISQEAMSTSIAALREEIPGSEAFQIVSHRAATLWINAASCWQSARLVTGLLQQQQQQQHITNDEFKFPQDLDTLARSSIYSTSPLVKACVALFSISNVAAIVDVCLTCAANFSGSTNALGATQNGETNLSKNNMFFQQQFAGSTRVTNAVQLPWEDGLYCTTTKDNNTNTFPVADTIALASSNAARDARSLFSAPSGVVLPSFSDATNDGMMSSSSPSALVVTDAGGEVAVSYAHKFCCSLLLHFLHLLLLRQQEDTSDQQKKLLVENMLSVCASSDDTYFHHMLYAFLLKEDYTSTLLRLQTPFLEEWLSSKKELLYRYYVVHQRHDLASFTMELCASTEAENIPLEKRIEFLTRAISSASAAVGAASSNAAGQENNDRSSLQMMKLNELKDKLEVASLQKKILSAAADGLDSSEQQSQALEFKLFAVSELFNNYAAPMGLYEICLLIMNVCKTNDSATIKDLWTRIISRQLQGVRSLSSVEAQDVLHALQDYDDTIPEQEEETKEFESGEWIRPLKDKITSLGKQLWDKGADFTFPLMILIPMLERLRQTFLVAPKGGHSQSLFSVESLYWPILSLSQAGIPYSTILEYYKVILSDKEREGDSDGSFHYLRCISEILTQWIKSAYSARSKLDGSRHGGENLTNAQMLSLSENSAVLLVRARSTGLLNFIDNCKSSLEAMVARSRDADQLLKIFTDVEGALSAF